MQPLVNKHFAALNPRLWVPMADLFRRSEGWRPPMMLVAVGGVVGFGGAIVRDSLVATTCLYAWGACWAGVFAIASSLAFYDSLCNLIRFGACGCSRSRFWFELARSSCLLGIIAASLSLPLIYAGPPVVSFAGDALLLAVISCFATFCIASTAGYLTMLVARQRPGGRAKQCVDFFYPQCLASVAVGGLLLMFRGKLDDPWAYGPVLAILIAGCLIGAIALALISRWRHHPPPHVVNCR